MSRDIDGSRIDAVLADAVERGAVPHVAAIAADRDGVLYEGGAGVRVAGESDDPVTTSTQFRIMSMTKMVCTAAALQQVERGELDLDAPVEQYRPEFADVRVLEGFDGDTPRLVEPARKATVHQLVTHTTGLGYWFWNAELLRYETATGVPNVVPGSARAFEAPMVAHPGTRYVYGINTDWLGRVVEAVAGTTLDEVIATGITGPLGMTDTMFRLDEERKAHCVAIHTRGQDGGWTAVDEILNQEPDWWAGGHGLYSTPRDYTRFARALLRGGELDGERILSAETVDRAFTNQIGDLDFPAEILTADPPITDSLRAGPGHTWGYGLLLNTEDQPGRRRAGTGSWAGLFNTHFFVDRTTGVCASIYTNSLPFIEQDGAWRVYGEFEEALYAAL
ncbi:CubicO group peptidase (beta-lactamase class C family) [Geodermatophilus bullaregiensis]|uniref:serine hydrolase domain-containing protein n=1 Tax=Geodermatophilus bullaregiensis TaxID=1564160 RepID=UPI00195EED9F|nr:serine hydrolase domain-containing protein [Geodermatophilus bullaregiensis]MBM7808339.1 CubicO group peptidase (beta-lactamase class C family) [Geodermatophilus bullaregiensis]